MDEEHRTNLEEELRKAVDTAREALDAAADALGISRQTDKVARRAIRDAQSAQSADVTPALPTPAEGLEP